MTPLSARLRAQYSSTAVASSAIRAPSRTGDTRLSWTWAQRVGSTTVRRPSRSARASTSTSTPRSAGLNTSSVFFFAFMMLGNVT